MGNPADTKEVTVRIPSNMDAATAQEVFLHGLRTMSAVYRSSAVVTYGIEKEGLVSYAFHGAEAGALVSFVTEVMKLNPKPWTERKRDIEDIGSNILQGLSQMPDLPVPGQPPATSDAG